MSEAQRLADALANARTITIAAANAAGKHRYRENTTEPTTTHQKDLRALVTAMETLHYLTTTDLPSLVRSLADDTYHRYANDHAPVHTPWPETVTNAAGEAHRALCKLRAYVEKTPVGAAHNTLNILLETVRTAHRRTNR